MLLQRTHLDERFNKLLDTTLLKITVTLVQIRKRSIESADHRIGDATRSNLQPNVRTTLL